MANLIVREFDTPCWQCDRKPRRSDIKNFIADDDDPNTCGICHGVGYQLNDSGRELLAFLERWEGRV